jgi:serine/threonine protein kinase
MASLQERAKRIFVSALALTESERELHIDAACGDDDELAKRVRELLAVGESDDAARSSALSGQAGAAAENHIDHLNRALEARYEILEEAGRGGMSVVYRARDVRHERDVALKVVTPEFAAMVGSERFLREIHIAASLQHAHIVPLYDSGDADGFLFYAMPFLEGANLRERIKHEGPLPVEDVLAIAREIADALDHAHAKGFVHRDIKPGNILFLNGRAMLADFGLATAFAGADEQKLTQSGVVLGTPQYMSPEQAVGHEADTRSDLYSLGCVVYEMLAGDPPFSGANVQAVLARHVSDPVSPIRTVRPQLPRVFDLTLSKALAKVPADRFSSATKLVEALASQRNRAASRKWLLPTGFAVLAAALALIATRPWESSSRLIPGDITKISFTSGPEYSGSLSPNMEYLAYSHTRHGTMDIYMQQLAGGGRVPLTTDEGDELLPRWSRDGTRIAYVKGDGKECDIYTIPLLERIPTKLVATGIPPIHSFWDAMEALGTHPWSRNDEHLLFSRRLETGEVAIFRVELETKAETQVTHPSPGAHDLGASWSHDDEWVVFTRSHGGAQELRLLHTPDGEEHLLLPGDNFIDQEPGFLPGDQYVIFSSNRSGMDNLWAIHIPTLELTRLTFEGGKDWYPTVAADGRIAYTRWSHRTDLYRIDMSNRENHQLTAFTGDNFVGRYAPGGDRVAYQSTQTANAEIWIHDLKTGKDIQFTNDESTDVLPEWSPDGEEIAFLSDRHGLMNILVANSDGTGRPERLSEKEIHIPSKVWAVSLSLRWTPDGESIGYVMADAQGPSLRTIDRHGPANDKSVYPGVLRFDWYVDRNRIVYTTMGEDGMELRAANLRTRDDVKLWAGPHSEMILAPDGGAVALVKSASHFNQGLYLLRLEPPTTEDGLPRPIGELEFITGGEGSWHVHNGGWSPDGKWIVYTQDTDDGDIYSLTLKEE